MSEIWEDKGRPVKPHRSGGGVRVAVSPHAGAGALAIAAMLAAQGMEVSPIAEASRRLFDEKPQPDSRGRRAEKDAAALEKAEAKRQRKAAKRAKEIEQC